MMASGCLPVVNSATYTRDIPFSNFIQYSNEPTTPESLAKALSIAVQSKNKQDKLFTDNDLKKYDWNKSNQEIENWLIKDLAGDKDI